MIVKADARHIPLADNSVQCVVTSPPYWGLRRYENERELAWADGWHGPFGVEPVVQMYVEHSVQILRELRRVLCPEGVCWWNIGDSYAGGGNGGGGSFAKDGIRSAKPGTNKNIPPRYGKRGCENGLKPKDLCMIPSRVALAAQADGWWVRSDIIWAKPNPMPESVRDRPTESYEHILMLTKSSRYYWNMEAVKEPVNGTAHTRGDGVNPKCRGWISPAGWDTSKGNGGHGSFHKNGRQQRMPRPKQNESFSAAVSGLVTSRNIRNVWTFSTQAYKGSHFATFPSELVIRCLQAATKPGDLVLDPFGGSGTVGEVAFLMGRRFILLDLAYQDLQRQRVPPMADLLKYEHK